MDAIEQARTINRDFVRDLIMRVRGLPHADAASELIGLDRASALGVFHVADWPEDLVKKYRAARTLGEERELMAQRLERLIEEIEP